MKRTRPQKVLRSKGSSEDYLPLCHRQGWKPHASPSCILVGHFFSLPNHLRRPVLFFWPQHRLLVSVCKIRLLRRLSDPQTLHNPSGCLAVSHFEHRVHVCATMLEVVFSMPCRYLWAFLWTWLMSLLTHQWWRWNSRVNLWRCLNSLRKYKSSSLSWTWQRNRLYCLLQCSCIGGKYFYDH